MQSAAKFKQRESMIHQAASASASTAAVRRFPILGEPDEAERPPVNRGWITRRLYDIGVLTMATSQPTGPELKLNVSTLGMWVAIIVAIAGGFWWAYQRGEQAGSERREQEMRVEQLTKEIEQAKQDAAEAKKLQTYQAGAADFHDNKDKEPKKK